MAEKSITNFYGLFEKTKLLKSTIHSDSIKSFMRSWAHTHKTVNGQIYFIDPVSQANIRAIERLWRPVNKKL